MNLYGFAGGDPVNYSDPMGLTVEFKGDVAAAKAVWNQLKRAARDAARSDDAERAAAGKALFGMMRGMERDKNVTYNITFGVFSQADLDAGGGGTEVCIRNECYIGIATNPGYPLAGRATALAHESGGAYGSRKGIGHYSADGAVKWENYARTIFSCQMRASHDEKPNYCR